MGTNKNSNAHLIFGILLVILVIVAGIITNLTSVGIGVLMGIVVLVGAPFMYKFMRRIPKHDDDIHYHEHDHRQHHHSVRR